MAVEHCKLPAARPLAYVSPSGAATLSQCLLQAAYASDPAFGRDVPSSPAARLGTACHEVLGLAGAGRLGSTDDPAWRQAFEKAWTNAIESQATASRANPLEAHWPPPERWKGYSMRKVATRHLAQELGRRVLQAEPDRAPAGNGDASSIQEQAQQGFGGRVRGRADVIRRGAATEIEDYKTGSIYEDVLGEVKQHYRVQMLLYAALEHEESGVWPARATLIPLEGERATIEVDPAEATATVEAALSALDQYNSALESLRPLEELGSPTPDACRFCPFATRCPAFWAQIDESWVEAGVLAVAGRITAVAESRLDTFNVELDLETGCVTAGPCLLYGLDAHRFGIVLEAPPGSALAATALIGNAEARQFRAGQRTRIVV